LHFLNFDSDHAQLFDCREHLERTVSYEVLRHEYMTTYLIVGFTVKQINVFKGSRFGVPGLTKDQGFDCSHFS
uniref:FERM domain-containing protein n=1 Tax=Haemonchus placei TaxID=6290 RepID=A0A0N4X7Q3_HAEPC